MSSITGALAQGGWMPSEDVIWTVQPLCGTGCQPSPGRDQGSDRVGVKRVIASAKRSLFIIICVCRAVAEDTQPQVLFSWAVCESAGVGGLSYERLIAFQRGNEGNGEKRETARPQPWFPAISLSCAVRGQHATGIEGNTLFRFAQSAGGAFGRVSDATPGTEWCFHFPL